MKTIINKIRENAEKYPDRIAFRTIDEFGEETCLSWKELECYSDSIAGFILDNAKTNTPVVVYGHKEQWMLVCFLGCVKSGRAYCPIDISVPLKRVDSIIGEVKPEITFSMDDGFQPQYGTVIRKDKIESIIQDEKSILTANFVKSNDVFYIIFTSGSTGIPKGVQITTECLDNFIKWGSTLLPEISNDRHNVFLNQAPFSFDLSVMDIYLSLYNAGTIFALQKSVQGNMKQLLEYLQKGNVTVWVSTPSFADICLADKSFCKELLPELKTFLFCGETLTNKTVDRLINAFPDSEIVNTYGPTESTVAVTNVTVTREMNKNISPLPIGKPKAGTWIHIVDQDGRILGENEKGEIVIIGDSVSIGYFHNREKTEKAFSTYVVDGKEYRSYHTGDEGYFKEGYLYYSGRIDNQIKLHGYRIELEDIENNLANVPMVQKAVAVPNYRNGKVSSISAYIVVKKEMILNENMSLFIKEEMKKYVPDYMIPKKIIIVDSIPMTANGKADRKALVQ